MSGRPSTDQFPDEEELTQVNFRPALATFRVMLGPIDEGEATLHKSVEQWPQSETFLVS